MGNQLVQTVNNKMPNCCNQVLNNDAATELRNQTSNSRLFMEEAKRNRNKTYKTNTLSLHSIDSPKSISSIISLSSPKSMSRLFMEEAKRNRIKTNKANNLSLHWIESPKSMSSAKSISSPKFMTSPKSNDEIYTLESSDSANDEILSNNLISKKNTNKYTNKYTNKSKHRMFIKIAESSTTSADHKLETVVINKPDNKKKMLKYKNKHYKNRIPKTKTISLMKELSECEIKLKQEQHEKDVLKLENKALRQKILEMEHENNNNNNTIEINTDLCLSDSLLSPKSTDDKSTDDKSNGYELLSPSNILTSPSISLKHSVTPSAYSICSPTYSTNTNINIDNDNELNEPIILNVSTKIKPKSASIPNFNDDIETSIEINIDNQDNKDLECDSIEKCESINGIICALKWYSINGNDHEMVYAKMKNLNYGKLILNYYNHIMEYHLNEKNKNIFSVQNEYKMICNEINKKVNKCQFKQCNGYRRYLRSRNCTNVHKAQTQKQHQLQIYVNTMDGIHTCFMHLTKSFQFK